MCGFSFPDKNQPSAIDCIVKTATLPAILVAVILAIVMVSFLFTILCFCHYRYKQITKSKDHERGDTMKYGRDHRKGLLEAMKTVKEMANENNSNENKERILEMMKDLIEALTDTPPSLDQAMRSRVASVTPEPHGDNKPKAITMVPLSPATANNVECDSGELVTCSANTRVAQCFAEVADRMLMLGLTNRTLEHPLKETLRNIPHLSFMKEVEVQDEGRVKEG